MLIERESSLEALQSFARRAEDGRGLIVLVTGEVGVGKTSLLQQFARLRHDGRRVLWGSCEALFTARPLGPLFDVAHAIDPEIFSLLDQGAKQDRLFPALFNALQKPRDCLVIIFEDVHWADNATLDLIKFLGRRASQLKMLLILTARSEEIGADHPLSQVIGDLPASALQRIELASLSRPAVMAMAEDAGRSGDQLFQITGGNPFFLTEILAGNGGSGEIPRSIRDAVWARVSRLGPSERKALELISLVPGSIESWLVQQILGAESGAVVKSCLSQGLIQYDENANIRFRHELARLSTLGRLNAEQQKALHARILACLTQAAAAGENIQISRLVHHAEGAADVKRVLALAPVAAEQAALLGAHQQAAAHLATALRHSEMATKSLKAQLNESWAYEAGLAVGINDEIIAARKRAIALWRDLKRPEKVALNLRWLSRLHWYRGESSLAVTFIDEALLALEGLPPGAELAMVYSARSQLHMLHDRTDEAILWGERAIALSESIGEIEARIHALNNVGSALLFSGRSGGEARIEESLSLALAHGFHEQAARAYTNSAEHAVVFKKFERAERILAEGIAFDTAHDLDAWTHYLVGRKAQLRMEQGRLREAEVIAAGVLGLDRLTLVMKLPSRIVLGKTRARLGRPDGQSLLNIALGDALATGEPQNITPVRLALAELEWLSGDVETARMHLQELGKLDVAVFDPWELGELAVWMRRSDLDPSDIMSRGSIASPRAAELAGDITAAAAEWTTLGLPYEAALTLLQSTGPAARTDLIKAVTILEAIEALPAANHARESASRLGVSDGLPKRRRGPYSAARGHAFGLTRRESEILGLIAQGMTNPEISDCLGRSQRTVEHHVSSILGKLNATTRIDILLRLRHEPWLLSSAGQP